MAKNPDNIFKTYSDDSPQVVLPVEIERDPNATKAFGPDAVKDSRKRDGSGIVKNAPRKFMIDPLDNSYYGGGQEVSENWPFTLSEVSGVIESNTPRETRGVTLSLIHI